LWHADKDAPGTDSDTEYDWDLDLNESVAADAYDGDDAMQSFEEAGGPTSAADLDDVGSPDETP
jgi:hypothetical protein